LAPGIGFVRRALVAIDLRAACACSMRAAAEFDPYFSLAIQGGLKMRCTRIAAGADLAGTDL